MRKRPLIYAVVGIAALAMVGVFLLLDDPGPAPENDSDLSTYGIMPDSLPAIVTDGNFPRPVLGTAESIAGLAGKDLRQKDLSRLSLETLAEQTFDEQTVWPGQANLPHGFSASAWLETGKDPGLGLRQLHARGLIGRDISVAIFDKPIRYDHQEFGGRLAYRQVAPKHRKRSTLHFHGMACASILAGQTCGVAPGARIYYFAVPNAGRNFYYYCLAMEQLIRLNRTLPPVKRIRLVSISDGLDRTNRDWRRWQAALRIANREGIAVLYSDTEGTQGFFPGGCPPTADRNRAINYTIAKYFRAQAGSGIIVPADYRTTAANDGNDAYVYWGQGGWSWALPYLSGLAALAWQIDTDLTLGEIMRHIKDTSTSLTNGYRIIDPAAFAAALKESSTTGGLSTGRVVSHGAVVRP